MAQIALLAVLSACGDGAVDPSAYTLTIAPETASLDALGDTTRFTATVTDQDGSPVAGGTVEWTSSDPAVAGVDGSGLVRAAGNGSARVTAASQGAAAAATVSVAQVAAGVSVTPGNFRFESLGGSARLTGTVLDANGHALPDAGVTWSSSDSSVVTVDASGLARPVANGRAEVRATSGALSGVSAVVVEQVAAAVALSGPGDTILVTDSVRLQARALDADEFAIPDALFRWESSDPDVARVNADGYVTGVSPGRADITASAGEASASVTVVVARYSEALALKALYDATNGDLWQENTNWLSGEPVSLWAGVHVNENGRVQHLVLPGNGLIGRIPPQIQHLEELESLHLGENDLEGPLPVEVTRLARLRSLDLNYNAIGGSLPPEIGNLSELVALSLFGNEVTGEIPPEIGRLAKLRYLDLCHNKLTGPIPAEIGNLGELRYLLVCGIDAAPHEGNRLSGEIPSTIGNLAQLRVLELGANELEGPIPPEIGNLTLLDTLSLYSNQLTRLPPEIGRLGNVTSLILYGNRLAGPIPSTIGGMTSLERLNLGIGYTSGNNLLTGSIPPEIGDAAELVEVDMGGNRLTGPIPSTIGNLERLRQLELGTNHLSGPVPSSIGNLSLLERFAVCPDSLEGPVPAEFGKLSRLKELHLCRNRFTGPLPAELGALASLRRLNLWENQLTGEIPATCVSLESLREINWVSNDGLCAPRTQEMEAWLDGLNRWFGDYCADDSPAGDFGDGGAPGAAVRSEGTPCWVTVAGRARAGAGGRGAEGASALAHPRLGGAGVRFESLHAGERRGIACDAFAARAVVHPQPGRAPEEMEHR